MKLSIFTILSVLTINIIFSACAPPKDLYYQSVSVFPIYQDTDNKLYFSYADGDDKSIYRHETISLKPRSLYLLNDNNVWEKIAIKDNTSITIFSEDYNNTKINFLYRTLTTSIVSNNMVSTHESILYENNIVKLIDIDTNEVIFSATLPTKQDIADATGIDLYNSSIKYYPLTEGQFYWDKQTHIATACVNELNEKCDNVYAFSLLKDQNSSWIIQNIAGYYTSKYYSWDLYDYIDIDRSNLSKTGSLSSVSGIFVKDNSGVIIQQFEEGYFIEYKKMIDDIYSNTITHMYNYTIDEQGNMHLFYNKKEDIKNENYDYFWYGYFTKENPTTPLYEQKIPWKY